MSRRSFAAFVTAVLLGWTSLGALTAGEAGAQALERLGQKCVNNSNKGLAKVAKVQRRENATCVKRGAQGRLSTTIEACLTADSRGRVTKAEARTTRKVPKACTTIPSFGIADASGATTNRIAIDSEVALIHAIFGPDLDAAIVSKDSDPAGHKCQAKMLRAVGRCQDAKLKAFNACKKRALKGRSAPAVSSAQELQDTCLGTGLSSFPDPKGKIRRLCEDRLVRATGRTCRALSVAGLFPGCAGEVLATCIDRSVTCETCLALNAVDGLARDCDALDDQLANGSCGVCTPGQDEPCYTGPPGTIGVGACRSGTRTCTVMGEWGSCSGEVTPGAESCAGLDDDCDGLVDGDDPDCQVCAPGASRACSTGLPGICDAGTQICNAQGTGFGPCQQDQLPTAEQCGNGLDDDCNGIVDDGCS